MSNDPYKRGVFKKNPYASKVSIKAVLNVILDGRLEERGLELMIPISRAVLKNEIHELILTDELEAGPGKGVDRIAYLGFMEIIQGGVIVAGDRLSVGGQEIGIIAGFDPTHLPNHLNIIVKSQKIKTGVEMNMQLGQEIVVERVTNHDTV